MLKEGWLAYGDDYYCDYDYVLHHGFRETLKFLATVCLS
jgi:hypothetical protein